VTIPPSNVPPRPLDKRDPNAPAARGTRSGGYGAEAGAPAGVWSPGGGEAPVGAPAAKPAAAPPAPVRTTVPKSAPAIPKAPVPVPFPPPELKAEVDALLARYPQRMAALIPILHLAQAKMGGWISPELEAGIAEFLGCSDQHVRGVVTFYTMFNTKPVGRHHVQVCRTLSCWLRGATGLTKCMKDKTGLSPGETDAERRFTVTEVECIGLCEVAPAIFVNDVPYGNVTPESLKTLLDGLA
jgi:NADH-quinone oxidoreductase subunit E